MALYVYLILTTTWFAQAEYGFATCFLSSPALFDIKAKGINKYAAVQLELLTHSIYCSLWYKLPEMYPRGFFPLRRLVVNYNSDGRIFLRKYVRIVTR